MTTETYFFETEELLTTQELIFDVFYFHLLKAILNTHNYFHCRHSQLDNYCFFLITPFKSLKFSPELFNIKKGGSINRLNTIKNSAVLKINFFICYLKIENK